MATGTFVRETGRQWLTAENDSGPRSNTLSDPSVLHRRITRRRMVQAGGVGLLGLSLPDLLLSDSLDANRGQSQKSCIFIFQYGGLSQLDSWDMKPEGPVEIRGPYRSIATATPGFRVCELMPNLARLSSEYAVIRSQSHKQSAHPQANQMLLAGSSQPARDSPSFGAIVTRLRPTKANVPPHVWLQKFGGGAMPPESAYTTGGHLGMRFAPMVIGERYDDNPANPDFRVRSFDVAEDTSVARLTGRRDLLGRLQNSRAYLGDTAIGKSTSIYQDQSFGLLMGNEARRAFDVQREPDALRDRYGRNPLGQNLLLARRLVEAGVRLVNVVAWTGLAPNEKFTSVETWDMHGNAGIGIFDDGWNGLGWALPRADQAVATLLEDLKDRGLLDSTLVVLVGEFGRTPRISRGAKAIGRDHWPNCYSSMIAGAGIRGGAVYGESDEHAAYVKSNPVSPEDFNATLFRALGIDPASRLSPDGFTQPASQGRPIDALF